VLIRCAALFDKHELFHNFGRRTLDVFRYYLSMLSGDPANFENIAVDSAINDWLVALRDHAVRGLLVLGPEPLGAPGERRILAVHPPHLLDAAKALADSTDFAYEWSKTHSPHMVWRAISDAENTDHGHWSRLWWAKGFRSFVRVGFSLPGHRAFECYAFSLRTWSSHEEPASAAWHTSTIWPALRKSLIEAYSPLSPREAESLRLAFDGMTARAAAEVMGCSERTVNFHITNATNKLKVDSKLAAVQQAIFLGCI
jgi:LuxR family transcriptional regulator, quorum-sensing system regulator SolR